MPDVEPVADQPQPTVNLPPEPDEKLAIAEHQLHWWRELLAGSIAVAIACFDVWWKGANAGFSNSLDEILLLTGVALIAGVRNLFAAKSPPTKNGFTLPLSFLVISDSYLHSGAGRCSTKNGAN